MSKYQRLKSVSVEEVLPLLGNPVKQKPPVRVDVGGEGGAKVNVDGLRLATFKHKGLTCVSCGIKGEFFAIEKTLKDVAYHINLYGVDPTSGLDVLMTHDHTLARSLGGKDDLSNAETMCSPCNFEKSKGENPKYKKKREAKTLEVKNSNPYFEYSKDLDPLPTYLHLRKRPLQTLEMA